MKIERREFEITIAGKVENEQLLLTEFRELAEKLSKRYPKAKVFLLHNCPQ